MTQLNDRSRAFKVRDASSYDLVTQDFARLTDRFSLPLAVRMVSLAQLSPAQRVLDVGTGTGIVALQAAQNVGSMGQVLGIDLSEGMVRAAKAIVSCEGLTNTVEFCRMDAEALALEDRSFDVVVSLFALLHFPNPMSALEGMFRVLRPGGKIVLAVGSSSPLLSLEGLAHRARLLPDILLKLRGRQLTAPSFLDALMRKYFPEPDELEESLMVGESSNRTGSIPELVRRVKFTKVRYYWENHKSFLETPEEFWDIQSTFSSVARKRLSAAPQEKVDAVKQEFLEICRKVQSRGGRFAYPVAALFITAQRPIA